MKFQLIAPGGVNLVRGYEPGRLRIGERTHESSVIVTASTVIERWCPAAAAEITTVDLEPLLGLGADVVLLGTGATQQFPEPAVLQVLRQHRIGVEVMDTAAACRTYNVLVGEGRPVAAALIV